MKSEQKILARRYAEAFNNVFGSQLTVNVVENFSPLADALEKDHSLLIYGMLESKEECIHQMAEIFRLTGCDTSYCTPLIELLAHDGRLILLPLVLRIFSSLYFEEHGIMHITIESALQLTQKEIDDLSAAFARKSGKEIRAMSIINPALIAGLKMYSESLGFEDSIRQRLSQLARDAGMVV